MKTLKTLAIAILCSAAIPLLAQVDPLKIDVTRVDGGYRLRYSDPDFDNKQRQVVVHDATRLSASIVSRVTREGPGLWRYDYEIANRGESDQEVAWWSTQVQPGTRIIATPVGWETTISTDGLSRLMSAGSIGNGVPPGTTWTGWSIVSESLPEVRVAEIRGAPQVDVLAVDLPAHVRRYIAELERGNSVSISVVAPWIPTRWTTRGRERVAEPHEILQRVLDTYNEPLRTAAAGEGARQIERAGTVLSRLSRAHSQLVGRDRIGARNTLGDLDRLLRENTVSGEPLRVVYSSLGLIVDHVSEQLR